MKVDYLEDYGYTVMMEDSFTCATNTFPSLEVLENHIRLMLIAVQNYKENTVD